MSRTAVSQFNIHAGDEPTRNTMPLLHEVKHALDKLIQSGEATTIDLRSIPLSAGEEDQILSALGQGEVAANLEALGPSEIIETAFSGVWVITHFNDDKEIVSRFIEITTMPDILLSQKEDVLAASSELATYLEGARNIQPLAEKSE